MRRRAPPRLADEVRRHEGHRDQPATSSQRTLSVTFLSIPPPAPSDLDRRSDVRQATGVPAIFSSAIR